MNRSEGAPCALAALVLRLSGGLCAAQEITVAAAADLQFVMQDVGVAFPERNRKNCEVDLRLFR